MLDQTLFTETLRLVCEMAKTSDRPMEKEEALSYFKDMELNEEQKELIFQFLLKAKEEPEGEEETEPEEKFDKWPKEGSDEKSEEEPEKENVSGETEEEAEPTSEEISHFNLYEEELQELNPVSTLECEALYRRLRQGDATVLEPLSLPWLPEIVKIAKEVSPEKAYLDDCVQEGNVALLMALQELLGSQGEIDEDKWIRSRIREAMLEYLGTEDSSDQQDEMIFGKITLLLEARKYLTEEKKLPPTEKELADYTGLTAEEIGDILSLIKETN